MKQHRQTRWILLCLLVWMNIHLTVGQTCEIINNDTIICQGTAVSFAVNTTGGTPVSYAWNFGNGFTASTATPSHTYTTAGSFVPTVIVTFAGGGSCSVQGKRIAVFSTPNASFNITTSREMCFKDNNMCVLDLSTPGSSNAPIKRRVFQLSNGYLKIEVPPYSPQICYHDTTDVMGHLFSIVMEVTDTNNCVSKFQKRDSVLLYPKFEKIDYEADIKRLCNQTVVTFTNTSQMPRARVARFVWQFGDGAVDSVNWLSTAHTYTGHGMYEPILIITDTQSCVDTVKAKVNVNVVFPDSAIYMVRAVTQCFKGNRFECISYSDNLFSFNWSVTDKDGNPVTFVQGPARTIEFTTPSCGWHKVRLTQVLDLCIVQTDSFVHVRGPKAVMENKQYIPTNGKQCSIRDTVFFVTPNPYLSCVYQNGLALKHLWDFDDAFAPQCTVDTRKGINIGMNCNFSRDSAMVNHVYTQGQEKCYYPSLFMIDTIHGCSDTTETKLALMAPDAGPAPAASPPRKGLIVGDSLKCFGDAVRFRFDVLPACRYSRAYINVDSACGKDNWILTDTLGLYEYIHVYQSTCSNDDYVTIGLIIANGFDQAGNICYDTAWYHHAIKLITINPKYSIKVDGCKPFHVTFTPDDSIQYNLTKVFWALNVGITTISDTFTQNFGPNDSIVYNQSAIFPQDGVYNSYSVFTNKAFCFQSHFQRFAVGFQSDFTATKGTVCIYDSVEFRADAYYWSAVYPNDRHPVNFWGIPARAAAGKENIWWDIGDGNGFQQTGERVNVRFDTPGKFTIKMLIKDSLSCYDTIVKTDYITVISPQAHIAQITQKYYCAPQIVLFRDSSLVFDSVPFTTPSTLDAITSWRWEFGDYTLESYLQDAGHNYNSNGSFLVRLIATTAAGCSDTDFTTVNIAGPAPSFTIEDTLGCEPFTAHLINTTGQALKSWTWYFGDSANQTYTTLSGGNVTFTYTKPGVYYLKLLGSQDVTNPSTGNTVNCNSFFPDPVTGMPVRKVVVLPTPPVGLEVVDSACEDEELRLISHSDTSYSKLAWYISTGDVLFLTRPDSISTYRFDTSGTHRIMLVGVQNTSSQCLDTAFKDIYIMPVHAEFTIDSSKTPLFRFQNASSGATRYLWNFGKPELGAANESQLENPECYFGPDTGTYEVCLTAYNALDCMDSVCKTVRVGQTRLKIPNVFTPSNSDNYNDAFDIDIVGYTEYHLVIYNSWGAKVYESLEDGYKNDGINWNGNDHQTGPPCADGTYYYVFTYKFYSESESKSVHGTITLIRD